MYTLLACCYCTILNLLPHLFYGALELETRALSFISVYLSIFLSLILYIYRVKQLLNLPVHTSIMCNSHAIALVVSGSFWCHMWACLSHRIP